MGQILLHFDGDITRDHRVSLRTLGKGLFHLQAAINRAYLDTKYGEVWKGARMAHEDYEATEFWSRAPQEGGYIIDFINDSPLIKKTLTRMVRAISPATEKAKIQSLSNLGSLADQAALRAEQVSKGIIDPIHYESYLPTASENPYGDRAINKEIDMIASIVRTPGAGNSVVELGIGGEQSSTFTFNRVSSENFHQFISKRSLGEPLIFSVRVTELDHKNGTGTIFNISSSKQSKLHFANDFEFQSIKKYLGLPEPMHFLGCPIFEGGAYDAKAGDIFFLSLV
ncbi:hypothetical protein [Ectopseudomonas mendocina]|uniref:hypothetical protein n=1 Tax=Ectopseudomonas mendocina TaxID=300 RepID=UPI000F6D636B|nr:hypothetical protein [Pseudomonas mendocina]VEE14543.1 Uncharacterised protein [Pseudomonas mendocina]